jgi:uncharacterized LabA/DUF88 family protein
MGPREIHYLFIDGGYFREVTESLAKKYWGIERVLIDYSMLKRGFTKVFYYDCPPAKQQSESQDDYSARLGEYRALLNVMHMSDGYHCVEGTTRGRPGRTRQKQIDVKIAVDMLTHAHRRNMHKVTLLTGDLDFKPVVDALVQDGMFVTLWYEKSSASEELIYAADAKRRVDLRELHRVTDTMIQGAFPMPDTRGERDKKTDGFSLVKKGQSCIGNPVELFRQNDLNMIVFRSTGATSCTSLILTASFYSACFRIYGLKYTGRIAEYRFAW